MFDSYTREEANFMGKVLKWGLLAVELFFLWMLCNGLFLVPGVTVMERVSWCGFAAIAALLTAWLSGRMFVKASDKVTTSFGDLVITPPCVLYVFVISVALVGIVVAVASAR